MMSGVESSAEASVADDAAIMQRLEALEDRVDDLEDENEELREELEAEREAREALIGTLGDTHPSDAMFDDVTVGGVPIERMLSNNKKKRKVLTRYVFGDVEVDDMDVDDMDVDDMQEYIQQQGTLPAQIENDLSEVEEQIRDEEENRGQQDAKLRRRIAALAEKTGVEIHESDILGDDKITRVLKHGVDDVESKPGTTDYRAQDVLRKIGKWGQTADDAHGKRILITSPTVVDRLDDYRDEQLATSQVKRIFEKIEEWGADSPRSVSADFSGDVNKLMIELDTEADR